MTTKVLTRADADIGIAALRAVAGRLSLKGDIVTSAKLQRVAEALMASTVEVVIVGGSA